MPLISVNSLSFSYEKNETVLDGVSFSVDSGDTWAIIGKNGSGKSTLLKCIGGLLRAGTADAVMVNGRPITAYRPKELAALFAYVPQANGRVPPPYSVADFVMLGRFPYQGFFAVPTNEDRRIVHEALVLTDTESLSSRPMNTLSGGEVQRVFLAAAVAQLTAVVLLDEPMSFLDPQHQELIHRSLERVHEERGAAMIAITHDVNVAVNRFSHICALVKGRPLFIGTAGEFKDRSPELLREIYSIEFTEIPDGCDRSRYFRPKGAV